MIRKKHNNTKHQRRLTFAKSCKDWCANQVGLGLRKRYARKMAQATKTPDTGSVTA